MTTTGGNVSYDGDTKVHTFLSNADFDVTEAVHVELLLVSGGCGSGMGTTFISRSAGAGAGGGVLHAETYLIPAGSYKIIVGSRGNGALSTGQRGGIGGATYIATDSWEMVITSAQSSGGGSSSIRDSLDGASTGGGALYGTSYGIAGEVVAFTNGHGHQGRDAQVYDGTGVPGGGGGAGGAAGSGDDPRPGGPGYLFHGTVYAKGGTALNGTADADPNTGNGGDSRPADDGGAGYRGGTGVVIIRILTDPVIIAEPFSSEGYLSGTPWLSSINIGAFFLGGALEGAPLLGKSFAVGKFSIGADLYAGPLLAHPMPRFALGADLDTPGTYLGYLFDPGHLEVEPALSGDFHRIVWWQDPRPVTAQQVYTCILTGHQDSTTDLALPMSSFQFRLYHHGGSYLSIVVPNAVLYAPQIAARLNGQLVVRQGYRQSDGTEQLAEMARAGQITLRHDTGARNSSATLTAGESITFSFDPGVVKKVTKLINRTLQADGNWQFRTVPIFGLFPGDSVEIDGTAWNVNRISVAVGKNLQTMDILSNGPS